MQAGVPEEATVEPDPDPGPDPAAPAALADDGALVDEVLTFEPPDPEADPEPDAEVDAEPGEAAEGVDDAAHPVASTPAAISGMASSAFFIGSTNAQ